MRILGASTGSIVTTATSREVQEGILQENKYQLDNWTVREQYSVKSIHAVS